ncbi:MAG: PaaI family thioesterase [Acidobacteria bacterium]|nr:MAG: PaaI family thioesterase [Acidobacteriota bacterium]
MKTESFQYSSLRNSHAHCLVCGALNPIGLRLDFHVEDVRTVSASLKVGWLLQGYSGVLHGGVISSLLDAAMTHCLFHRGIEAVTAELLVRYLRPVPVDAPLELRAILTHEFPPLYRLRAELRQADQLMAYARAKFVHRPSDCVRPGSV